MQQPLDRLTFVAIDTETTGGSPRYAHRIVEIGAARFTLAGVAEVWETPLWPHRPISEGAQRVHGLSAELLHDAPCFHEVVHSFLDFVAGATVVMHNAPFDASFFATHLAETGHRWQPTIWDTLRLLRRNFSLPSNSLGPAIRHFGIPRDPTHRAAADAIATADLFRVLVERTGARTIADLERRHGPPAALPRVTLPPCDATLQAAIQRQSLVEVAYATRPQPLVGRIEGVALGEAGSYCTLRVTSGKRLHLLQERIRGIVER